MVSIIIAAFNEEAVIGGTLDALLLDAQEAEIIVVANGCNDDTAGVARRRGVRVIELEQGGKPGALNAGEALATSFPRIYLDADIRVPTNAVPALVRALEQPGKIAATPGRTLDTEGRPLAVRAYAAIHSRLPAIREGLYGRGMIALSAEGRARFGEFPTLVADDVFVDSLFTAEEKAHVESIKVIVEAPFTTKDLLRRLVRVRRGLSALRRAAEQGQVTSRVRPADRWSWLRDVVRHEPALLPAGIVYAAINLIAAVSAKRGSVTAMDWGRDESTRFRA